jgi:hypothetical protein
VLHLLESFSALTVQRWGPAGHWNEDMSTRKIETLPLAFWNFDMGHTWTQSFSYLLGKSDLEIRFLKLIEEPSPISFSEFILLLGAGGDGHGDGHLYIFIENLRMGYFFGLLKKSPAANRTVTIHYQNSSDMKK